MVKFWNNHITVFLFPYSVLPRIAPFDFGEPVNLGEAAQVGCFITEGDLPVVISWLFNGVSVSKIPDVSTPKVGRKGTGMVIDPTSSSHQGNYTCAARNKAGTVNYTSPLFINGNEPVP